MANKPRIAFCFSWQARTLDQTYLFFQKNLYDAAKEQWFDYDVFCAVEDDEDVDKVNLLNPTKVEKIKSSDVEKIIYEKYWKNLSENILGNDYFFSPKAWHSQSQDLYSYLQQLYKLWKSIELEKCFRYENNIKYEIVFRLRYDCPFLRKLNFKKIAEDVKKWILICNTSCYKSWLLDCRKDRRKIIDFFFMWNSEEFDLIENIFYQINGGLKWNEIRHKRILHFINCVENFIIKFNRNVLWFRLIPVLPITLIWNLFYKKLTPEMIYYCYFINKGLTVHIENFSFFFLKRELKDCVFKVEESNIYEIDKC